MLPPTDYLVRVDACPNWKDHRTVTFGMCMGNEHWEGQKFVTLLEWAARNFDFIRVALSDTLGRHNFIMGGIEPNLAMQKALQQGNVWLDRHADYLRLCGKPYSVVRWDYWRNQPDFVEVQRQFESLASDNGQLSTLLTQEIEAYAERFRRRGLELSNDFARHCRAYLVEELAGTTLRARAIEKGCRIYPAPEQAWLKIVRAGLVPDAPRGLENEYYVAINLRRRKSQTPGKMTYIIESAA